MSDFIKLLSKLLLAAGAVVLVWLVSIYDARPTPEDVAETPEPETAEPPQTVVKNVSLYMLGDAMAQTLNVYDAEREDGTYDFSSQMDGICDAAKDYDLAFFNNECILGGEELGITPFPHFNCVYDFGDYMVSKGFNLVSTANNHALDKDEQGVINSCSYWEKQKDVITSGLNLSQEEREAVSIFEKNDITFAFTAWTYDTNGNLPPAGKEYMVNTYRGHEEEMLARVSKAKEQADFVIVSMHWGTEYTHEPDSEQIKLAQQLADAGADLIIGNHAHNIQPVTWLNDGKTLCYYALGNCLSAMDIPNSTTFEEVNTGIVSTLNFQKTIEPDGTIKTAINDVRADLTFTYNTNDYEHMYSVMYSDLDEDILPDKEEWYQKQIDVIHKYTDDIAIGLH